MMMELREQQALEVIQLVVQHCCCKPSLICKLLQVNTQVNQALRGCRGQLTVVAYVSPNYDVDRACRPWAFARCLAWLVKYGGLVSSLIIQHDTYAPVYHHRDEKLDDIDELCQQLLDTNLQLAASLAATSAVLPAPGSSAQKSRSGSALSRRGSPASLPLLLEEFASEYRISPTALLALARFKVQHASIQYRAPCTSPAFCAAFGQLTTLKSLTLTGGLNECIPDQLAAEFGKLRGLTHLTCDALQPRNAPQLPAGLQSVDVTWTFGDRFVDLSYLTALKDLKMRNQASDRRSYMSNRAQMDVILPAQLTCLEVGAAVRVSGCDCLRELRLEVHDYGKELDVLQDLSGSTQLQELRVVAAATASCLSGQRVEQAVAAIKQMTQLTRLVVDINGDRAAQVGINVNGVFMSTVPLCESIAHLPKLQSLVLHVASRMDYRNQEENTMSSRDLLHLSELTQLTTLQLTAPALNDFGVITLLSKLTGLEQLELETRSVRSAGLLPVLANLQALSWLELRILSAGYDELSHYQPFRWASQELLRLSTLTKLRHLRMEPDGEAMQDLFEALNLSAPLCRGRYGYESDNRDNTYSGHSSPSYSGSQSD